ncbi:MAG: hypothetical protein RI897_1549 [Verrucomicrobiota bacterium]|jgi:Spy/CpxP family protein refolding chaperone
MKLRTRNILVVTAIFLAGMITGGLPSAVFGERIVEHRLRVENLRSSLLQILERELDLTGEQLERIDPIVTAACEEYREMTQETVGRVGKLVQDTNEQIARVLTPEQASRLAELEAERQDQVRRRMDQDYLKKDFLAE